MYRTIFLTDAKHEVDSAAKWYPEQQENLDKQFKENILKAIEKLQSDQIIYGSVYNGLSRVFVKRFPYSIYFRKDMERKLIIIFGVLHSKQSRSRLDIRL